MCGMPYSVRVIVTSYAPVAAAPAAVGPVAAATASGAEVASRTVARTRGRRRMCTDFAAGAAKSCPRPCAQPAWVVHRCDGGHFAPGVRKAMLCTVDEEV